MSIYEIDYPPVVAFSHGSIHIIVFKARQGSLKIRIRQFLEIYEKELKDAKWELDYHTSKVEKAKSLIDLFTKKMEEAKEELKLQEAFGDEC